MYIPGCDLIALITDTYTNTHTHDFSVQYVDIGSVIMPYVKHICTHVSMLYPNPYRAIDVYYWSVGLESKAKQKTQAFLTFLFYIRNHSKPAVCLLLYRIWMRDLPPFLLKSHLFNMLLEACRQLNRSTPRRQTATNTHTYRLNIHLERYCLSLYVFHVPIAVAAAVVVANATAFCTCFYSCDFCFSFNFVRRASCTIKRNANNNLEFFLSTLHRKFQTNSTCCSFNDLFFAVFYLWFFFLFHFDFVRNCIEITNICNEKKILTNLWFVFRAQN